MSRISKATGNTLKKRVTLPVWGILALGVAGYVHGAPSTEQAGKDAGSDIRTNVAPVVGDVVMGGVGFIKGATGIDTINAPKINITTGGDSPSNGGASVGNDGETHTVIGGDNWWGILGSFGLNGAEIQKCVVAKHLDNVGIHPGQVVSNPC